MQIKIVVMRHLKNPKAWFLLAKEREPLIFIWRMKPDLKDDSEFYQMDINFSSVMRFCIGTADWKFIVGVK